MTHTRQYEDSEGTFQKRRYSERPCRFCNLVGHHFYELWESSDGGYEDERHHCDACGKSWWVDGIDS